MARPASAAASAASAAGAGRRAAAAQQASMIDADADDDDDDDDDETGSVASARARANAMQLLAKAVDDVPPEPYSERYRQTRLPVAETDGVRGVLAHRETFPSAADSKGSGAHDRNFPHPTYITADVRHDQSDPSAAVGNVQCVVCHSGRPGGKGPKLKQALLNDEAKNPGTHKTKTAYVPYFMGQEECHGPPYVCPNCWQEMLTCTSNPGFGAKAERFPAHMFWAGGIHDAPIIAKMQIQATVFFEQIFGSFGALMRARPAAVKQWMDDPLGGQRKGYVGQKYSTSMPVLAVYSDWCEKSLEEWFRNGDIDIDAFHAGGLSARDHGNVFPPEEQKMRVDNLNSLLKPLKPVASAFHSAVDSKNQYFTDSVRKLLQLSKGELKKRLQGEPAERSAFALYFASMDRSGWFHAGESPIATLITPLPPGMVVHTMAAPVRVLNLPPEKEAELLTLMFGSILDTQLIVKNIVATIIGHHYRAQQAREAVQEDYKTQHDQQVAIHDAEVASWTAEQKRDAAAYEKAKQLHENAMTLYNNYAEADRVYREQQFLYSSSANGGAGGGGHAGSASAAGSNGHGNANGNGNGNGGNGNGNSNGNGDGKAAVDAAQRARDTAKQAFDAAAKAYTDLRHPHVDPATMSISLPASAAHPPLPLQPKRPVHIKNPPQPHYFTSDMYKDPLSGLGNIDADAVMMRLQNKYEELREVEARRYPDAYVVPAVECYGTAVNAKEHFGKWAHASPKWNPFVPGSTILARSIWSPPLSLKRVAETKWSVGGSTLTQLALAEYYGDTAQALKRQAEQRLPVDHKLSRFLFVADLNHKDYARFRPKIRPRSSLPFAGTPAHWESNTSECFDPPVVLPDVLRTPWGSEHKASLWGHNGVEAVSTKAATQLTAGLTVTLNADTLRQIGGLPPRIVQDVQSAMDAKGIKWNSFAEVAMALPARTHKAIKGVQQFLAPHFDVRYEDVRHIVRALAAVSLAASPCSTGPKARPPAAAKAAKAAAAAAAAADSAADAELFAPPIAHAAPAPAAASAAPAAAAAGAGAGAAVVSKMWDQNLPALWRAMKGPGPMPPMVNDKPRPRDHNEFYTNQCDLYKWAGKCMRQGYGSESIGKALALRTNDPKHFNTLRDKRFILEYLIINQEVSDHTTQYPDVRSDADWRVLPFDIAVSVVNSRASASTRAKADTQTGMCSGWVTQFATKYPTHFIAMQQAQLLWPVESVQFRDYVAPAPAAPAAAAAAAANSSNLQGVMNMLLNAFASSAGAGGKRKADDATANTPNKRSRQEAPQQETAPAAAAAAAAAAALAAFIAHGSADGARAGAAAASSKPHVETLLSDEDDDSF